MTLKKNWHKILDNSDQSCGMTGLRAENNLEVEAKMKELFQVEGPALLEVITDPDKL